jgi:hypothetical protein
VESLGDFSPSHLVIAVHPLREAARPQSNVLLLFWEGELEIEQSTHRRSLFVGLCGSRKPMRAGRNLGEDRPARGRMPLCCRGIDLQF